MYVWELAWRLSELLLSVLVKLSASRQKWFPDEAMLKDRISSPETATGPRFLWCLRGTFSQAYRIGYSTIASTLCHILLHVWLVNILLFGLPLKYAGKTLCLRPGRIPRRGYVHGQILVSGDSYPIMILRRIFGWAYGVGPAISSALCDIRTRVAISEYLHYTDASSDQNSVVIIEASIFEHVLLVRMLFEGV